jgi:hypothetical protein
LHMGVAQRHGIGTREKGVLRLMQDSSSIRAMPPGVEVRSRHQRNGIRTC